MSKKVFAQEFHPMRGHVEDGVVVLFSDGRQMTVRSAPSIGWNLVDQDGGVVFAADGAYELTAQIVQIEEAA